MKSLLTYSILIVDDDEQFRLSLSKIFIKEGYKVTTAQNAEEAWRCLDHTLPQLVIIDQRLPGMTGLELVREIKGKSPKSKLLVVSAYGDMATRNQAMEDGAFAFLDKPIKRQEILEWAIKAMKAE